MSTQVIHYAPAERAVISLAVSINISSLRDSLRLKKLAEKTRS
jgi:hypothetical protein